MRRLNARKLRLTAYHEAGHAIAAWIVGRTLLGRPKTGIGRVRIATAPEPIGNTGLGLFGMTEFGAFYPHEFLPAGGLQANLVRAEDVRSWRLRLEAQLIVTLAGPLAEARISRRKGIAISEHPGAFGDNDMASSLLASFFGKDDPTNPEQQMLWWGVDAGASRIIRHPDAWAAIEALAIKLIEKGAATGHTNSRIAKAKAGATFTIARVAVEFGEELAT